MSQKWLTSGANRLREKRKLEQKRSNSIQTVNQDNCVYRTPKIVGTLLVSRINQEKSMK